MKKFFKRWFATTKHLIISDSEKGFQELFIHTIGELESLGQTVVRIKIRKKKYNQDYSGYAPNYQAIIWTKSKEEIK